MENAQKKELEEHIDVLLKMEQERLIILKENQQLKSEKVTLCGSNENYQEKLGLFESHLTALKQEIKTSQQHNKKMMEEKEKLVEDLRKEVEMLSEKLKKRGLFKSSSKTMTGLPKDKIQ